MKLRAQGLAVQVLVWKSFVRQFGRCESLRITRQAVCPEREPLSLPRGQVERRPPVRLVGGQLDVKGAQHVRAVTQLDPGFFAAVLDRQQEPAFVGAQVTCDIFLWRGGGVSHATIWSTLMWPQPPVARSTI